MTDDLTLNEVGVLDADDCVTKKNGKIRCRSDDKTLKVTFKPSKQTPGEYGITVKIKGRDFGEPVAGPIRVDLAAAGVEWAGRITLCAGLNAKVVCKN